MSPNPDMPLSASGREPLAVALEAAESAGGILKDYFYGDKHVEAKGKRNLVSHVDLLAERCVMGVIQSEYPQHRILSEESGSDKADSEYCWIIDPLDGTTNYVFGIPHFAVSIALTWRDEIMVGVVHDPLRNEMFWAEKGGGAFLNGNAVSVARDRGLDTMIIGTDLGYDDGRTRQMLSRINELWSAEMTFRLMGSAALGVTYVACGRLNAYAHRRIYPWDVAAAILLVREAGGEVTRWEGGQPAVVWDESIIACGDPGSHQGVIASLSRPFDC